MNYHNIEQHLQRVIDESEQEVVKNSGLPECLKRIRKATSKINDDLTVCMVNDNTKTKNDYLKCLNNTYSQVNAAYKDIILSDSCLNDGVINRRKALVFLGALWELGNIRDCLQNNGYTAASKCIKQKIGWILPGKIDETVSKETKQSKKLSKKIKKLKSKKDKS